VGATIDLGGVVRFMLQDHPYQNVYFNALVRGVRGSRGYFEIDYWGLSCRETLEHLLRNETVDPVRVAGHGPPVKYNSYILPIESRHRLHYVHKEEAEFFVVYDYLERDIPEGFFGEPYFSVMEDGIPLASIYRRSILPSTRVESAKGHLN
jgi:hypothetical protein